MTQSTQPTSRAPKPIEIAGILLAAILAISSAGCGFTGESGNIRFFFETAEFGAKQPVAVNSHVTVNAYENTSSGDSQSDENSQDNPITLTDVTSSDSSILEVTSVGTDGDNAFRLSANSPGTVDISVEGTTDGGTTITDSFSLSAAQAESIEFEHGCETGSTPPFYLTEQDHVIRMRLYSADGDRLVGAGYRPVNIDGPGSDYSVATGIEQTDRLGITFGFQSGTVTVNSTIDDASIQLDALSEASITELDWFAASNGTPTLFPTSDSIGRIFPQFKGDGRLACNARVDLDYSVQTPDVCSVETQHLTTDFNWLTEVGHTQTAIAVTESSDDICEFDVSVPGTSLQVSETVQLDLAENGPDEQN